MEEEIVMVPGDEFEHSQEKFIWNQTMVRLLIREYKKVQHMFRRSQVKKKDVWQKIAGVLAEHDCHVTEEMCDKKWRNLKKTFKEIYVGQRSIQSKTRWPYYQDLEVIFKGDPNIIHAASSVKLLPHSQQPIFKKILGSDGNEVRVELVDVGAKMEDDYEEPDEPGDGEDGQFWTAYENQTPQEPPTWFSEFLQQYRQDEERRMAVLNKMHADILAVEEKKCLLLGSLIEKLGGLQESESVENDPNSFYLQLTKDDIEGEIVSE